MPLLWLFRPALVRHTTTGALDEWPNFAGKVRAIALRCLVCVVALLRSRDGAIAVREWRHRGPCVCGDRRCRPCGIRFVFGAGTSRCSGGAVFRCLHCTWPPGSAARTWYQLYHRSEFCCCRRFHNSAFCSCIFFRRILQLRRQNILEEFEKSSEICFFLLVCFLVFLLGLFLRVIEVKEKNDEYCLLWLRDLVRKRGGKCVCTFFPRKQNEMCLKWFGYFNDTVCSP